MTAQPNVLELARWLQSQPGITASCRDEAVAQMSHRFKPHVINGPPTEPGSMDFQHYEKSFHGITVNYLQYGPDVQIDAGDFETFYMLEIPLVGGVEIPYSDGNLSSSSIKSIILSPGQYINSKWKYNTKQIMLKIDKRLVVKSIEKRFGKADSNDNFIFEPYIASESLPLTRIVKLLKIWSAEEAISGDGGNYDPRPLLEAIVDTLVGNVAFYTAPISSQLRSGCLPGHLARFLSLVDDPKMLSRPISELALQAGTTDRTLRNSAQRFLKVSPHELIVRKRLERARQILSQSDLPIGHVAAMAGYSNASRFSKAYKSFFGYLPSRDYETTVQSGSTN
ncbi:AraC family transcriptional regulator [Agrobacterium vitis]